LFLKGSELFALHKIKTLQNYKHMKTKLNTFRIRFTNVYLIEQDGRLILLDTGTKNQEKNLMKAIRTAGYDPSGLDYIFLTHTHYDHAGSVAAMKKQTGACVIVHESEAGFLKNGFTPIPGGTTHLFKFISFMGRRRGIEKKVASYQALEPDITFEENLNLQQYGFDAQIIHTPGHTIGSSSLLLGDKAFVGDAMFNFRGMIYPGFADDEKQVGRSWEKLLDLDVKWYYPAHGKRLTKTKLNSEARKRGVIK